MQLSTEDYIRKLIMLENAVGANTKYRILDPLPFNPRDIIEIQEVAKKIAEFIGLDGLTFIVAIAKQKEKQGGHVELQAGQKEVFIEISDDTARFSEAVLATLSHEITHKYLQINGVSVGSSPVNDYENEVLTDVTTVFLGLGKLMLNGCYVENTRQEFRADGTYNVTESLKSGYLEREQLAFVYQVVCAMRGISSKDMLSELSKEATAAVQACSYYRDEFFNPQFSTQEYRNGLGEALEKETQTLRRELNHVSQHLEFLKKTYVSKTEVFLEAKHKGIAAILHDLKSMRQSDSYDPCLLFLNTIGIKEEIEQRITKVEREIAETIELRQRLNEFTRLDQKEKSRKPRKESFLRKIFRRKSGR